MNARQKAKKYKRLYHQLLASPINFTVNTVNYHTVMAQKSIPEEVALSCIKDDTYIRESLSRVMVKEIMPYIKINTQYEPRNCSYTFAAMLRIVDY